MTAPRPCRAELLMSSDPDISRWWCPECGPNISGPCDRAGARMRASEPERLRGLLAESLGELYSMAETLIFGGSRIDASNADDPVPMEGFFVGDDEEREEIESLLDLIRRIEDEGARPVSEQPAWLIEIVQERRAL